MRPSGSDCNVFGGEQGRCPMFFPEKVSTRTVEVLIIHQLLVQRGSYDLALLLFPELHSPFDCNPSTDPVLLGDLLE